MKPSPCTARPATSEVVAFNDNPYADYWLEKHLKSPSE
jgi:hypothetical protein